MVEILSNSLAITTTSHGYSCSYHSYSPGIHEYRTRYPYFSCCIYLSSDTKSNRRRTKSYGLKMMTLPYLWRKGIKSSHVCDSSFAFQRKVAIVEYGLACEEENILSRREKEETDLNLLKLKPPPWDNSSIQLDSDSATGGANQSSTISERAGTRNDNRHRVHFLEERNEERLSERILNLSRTNKSRSAMELYWSMEYSGLKPTLHACNSLISCLLRNKMLDDALSIFKAMKASDNITAHTCSLVLKAIGNAQGCDAALDIFEELGRNGNCKKVFDAVVYNTMISICGKGNDWVEILRIWRSMKENGLAGTAVTYSLLVSIFVRCGQNELAIDAYHEMLQDRLNPANDEMQAIIGACGKEGKWDLALNVFENMLKRGLKPNLVTCNALINAFGKDGKVKLAFRIYSLLKSFGHSPDSYTWNALIGALYRANRHADALHLFESIQKEKMSPLDLHIYNTCLMSCQRLGWWDRALQLLWQMEASGLPVSTPSYNLVIGACQVARKPNVALEVYEHMLDRKCASDTFTLLALIRVCIWGSLWYEVEQMLNQGTPDASLYNAAIQGMCLRGKSNLAKELYARMRRISLKPDGKTRALMLQIFTERPVPLRKR